MQLSLVHVSFAYADAVPLLVDVSVDLTPGWHGLAGPNGAGKTTLLRLLAGQLTPERGAVRCRPAGTSRVLCRQDVTRRDDGLAAGASVDPAVAALRDALALEPSGLERWPTLSPGERKRWQIAAALAAAPDVLLLDEPTNHLDADAREHLVAALRAFEGIGVIVSHDRTVLDALTGRTLWLQAGRLRVLPCAYGQARAVWDAEERQRVEAARALRRAAATLEGRLAAARERRDQAAGRMRTSRQMKSIHDGDARGRGKATRRRSAERAAARDIRATAHALGRVQDVAARQRVERTHGKAFPIVYTTAPASVLLRLHEPALVAGDRVLARDVAIAVRRTDRIRLSGPNGAGKTTLLRALLRTAPADRVLYLPQDLDPAEEQAALALARRLPPDGRGRTLALVSCLGVDPDRLLTAGYASPGEARKLALALGLARGVSALVLDEPTNHLDLPSVERLEAMVGGFPGALVLVTHDDVLAGRLTTTRWELRDGHVRVA